MSDLESIRQAFERVEPQIAAVARHVRETLEPYCRQNGYLFTDRSKTLPSLVEKLEGGRTERWSDIDDLYACTVVVPVRTHEARVLRKLDSAFARKDLRSRAASKKPPDVFRFDGTRWYGTISEVAAATRAPGIGDLKFEVQVVTSFEYAWIAVTHDLVYKGETVDWKRQRLAAQLKAAVEQVEVLIAAFESASDAVLLSPWPETEIKARIAARFKQLFEEGYIPDTIIPSSWRRFSDNVYSLVSTYQRDPNKIGQAVDSLFTAIDKDLLGANPTRLPTSGTLFQYVISVVYAEDTEGSLAKFTVVPSRELNDLYQVRDLPRQFTFDGGAEQYLSGDADGNNTPEVSSQ